ncbi:MAG: hypothetical protein AYK18_05500 [Theionarchaea archaeon DG-70]|nr:MAG: hypothetical protein AYK18_05500 [Theionarchaea archaeon DG-70]
MRQSVILKNVYIFLYLTINMETVPKSTGSRIGTEKIAMIVALIVAGICGAKVLQEVAIVKYAVFWHFLRTHHEFALEAKAYVPAKLYCTSVCSLMVGFFLVVSFWAGIALLRRKTKTSNLKKLGILVIAVLLTVLGAVFAVKCIQDATEQPPFLAQESRTDLWNEYQIHVASKVRPIAVFSFLTGVSIAVFSKFLIDVRKPSTKPPPEAETDALSTLKNRLVKGEITAEEYKKMKTVLERD